MTDDDWKRATDFYGPHDAYAQANALADSVRKFAALTGEDREDVVVEVSGDLVDFPYIGRKRRLYSADLETLVAINPEHQD